MYIARNTSSGRISESTEFRRAGRRRSVLFDCRISETASDEGIRCKGYRSDGSFADGC